MNSLGLPRPDLFIAALGRSGSTMLANVFTRPPTHWVVVEPRFADFTSGRDLLVQANSVGMSIRPEQWERLGGEGDEARVTRVYGPILAGLDRWGLKEVRPDLLWSTVECLDPVHTIVLVRDLRDAAVSLLEKTAADNDPRYDHGWLRRYLTASPAAILDLVPRLEGRSHRIVTYESLVDGSGRMGELGEWLDWPVGGRPDRHLGELFNRQREVDLHAGAVTQAAIGRHRNSNHPLAAEFVAWVEHQQADFQRAFGYA